MFSKFILRASIAMFTLMYFNVHWSKSHQTDKLIYIHSVHTLVTESILITYNTIYIVYVWGNMKIYLEINVI